jgi:hypothetical protein
LLQPAVYIGELVSKPHTLAVGAVERGNFAFSALRFAVAVLTPRPGEFSAQQILVGVDLRIDSGMVLEPPHGHPHRAAMDEKSDDKHAESREEKSDPEIHERFDHDHRLQSS